MPEIKETTTINGRTYTIEGEDYTSVTTPFKIISMPFLKLWETRVGVKTARGIASKAANYGSKIHGYCEDYLTKGEIKPPKKYKADMDAFIKWADENIEEKIASEKVVWSPKYLVAGRYDFLGKIKGYDGLCIVDWKTGRLRPEHFLQLAAYRKLTAESTDIPLEDIKHRLVVSIKNGKCKAIPPDKKNPTIDPNLDVDFEVYLSVLNVYNWMYK